MFIVISRFDGFQLSKRAENGQGAELVDPEVALLASVYNWSEHGKGQAMSMLLDRLEAVDTAADFLSKRGVVLHVQAKKARTFRISHGRVGDTLWSYPNFDFYICSRANSTHWRGYSRRSGPLYSDAMIFPRRKRYWKKPQSTNGLVLWTFNRPEEYLTLLYGAKWFTDCRREESHADEANRITAWDDQDQYIIIPCAEVASVVEFRNASEDLWSAVFGALTAELGSGWHCEGLPAHPPEAGA